MDAACPPDTKSRLIEAAARIFGEKGFEGAGIREICEAAETNVASVRYHFTDKAGLYRETLAHAQSQTFMTRPLPDLTDDPEADLVTCIEWFLTLASTARTGPFGRLMMREMLDPTDALDLMVERGVRPLHGHVTQLVERVIAGNPPPRLPPQEIAVCIVGLCVHRIKAYPVISRVLNYPGPRMAPDPADLPRLARLIATFAIDGIRSRATQEPPDVH